MKYIKIEIQANIFNKTWQVFYTALKDDRKRQKTSPHPFGFYYCPESEGVKKGFEKLKNFLIVNHEKEIKRLQISLDKLKELTLPEKDDLL